MLVIIIKWYLIWWIRLIKRLIIKYKYLLIIIILYFTICIIKKMINQIYFLSS